MVILALVLLWTLIGIAGWSWFRINAQREQSLNRFHAATSQWETSSREEESSVTMRAAAVGTGPQDDGVVGTRRLTRRWIGLPWLLGIGIAITIWAISGWSLQYVLAIGAVISLLLSQFESMLHTKHIAKLERQLADSIDIMVGAVSAGAAVGPAMDAAAAETTRPLKPYLLEVSGRIRLGDDPASVFRSLSARVPLETFLLFCSSMGVHYEVGGRLAPTLATVGRTIRDRIEVNRRIQSNIAQSQFSTFAILGMIYLIAVIVWRNGPDAMVDFVSSSVGSTVVAGSIIMQAVGIVWMNLLSKPKF